MIFFNELKVKTDGISKSKIIFLLNLSKVDQFIINHFK